MYGDENYLGSRAVQLVISICLRAKYTCRSVRCNLVLSFSGRFSFLFRSLLYVGFGFGFWGFIHTYAQGCLLVHLYDILPGVVFCLCSGG